MNLNRIIVILVVLTTGIFLSTAGAFAGKPEKPCSPWPSCKDDGGEPLPDVFTVKIRFNDDSTGVDLPGPVVRKLDIGQATTRTATGVTFFGVREFEYTISLPANQDLQPGLYWIEIYNDTTNDPTNDDWFWEAGSLDAVNGLTGSAFSRDLPNDPKEQWTIDPLTDLALSITCKGE